MSCSDSEIFRTKAEREKALQSCRHPVFSRHAIIPKLVDEEYCCMTDLVSILDYGAGKHAAHVLHLRSQGYTNVTAYDLPENQVDGLHDPSALWRTYDCVYASNVLNVLSTRRGIAAVVNQIFELAEHRIFLNFTSAPRYLNISDKSVNQIILEANGRESKYWDIQWNPVDICGEPGSLKRRYEGSIWKIKRIV